MMGRRRGTQITRALVGRAVLAEGIAVGESVDPKAQVRAMRERQTDFAADSQGRDFDTYPDGHAPFAFPLRWNGGRGKRCARGGGGRVRVNPGNPARAGQRATGETREEKERTKIFDRPLRCAALA